MPHLITGSPPPSEEVRATGTILGLIIAFIGIVMILGKFWAHQHHVHQVYGLTAGINTFHMACMTSGLFVTGLGIALVLKSTCGKWVRQTPRY